MIKKIISNFQGGVFLKRNISTIFEGEFLRRAFSILFYFIGRGGFCVLEERNILRGIFEFFKYLGVLLGGKGFNF